MVPHLCLLIIFQKLHMSILEGWNDFRNDPEVSIIDFIFMDE